MSLLTKLAVLSVLLAVLAGAAWKVHDAVWQSGYQQREREAQARELLVMKHNDRVQLGLQADADNLKEQKNAQVRDINSRLVDALGDYSMLQRSVERRPDDLPSGAGTCGGATGAGLSRPDAAFLEREAARANTLRAALRQCYAQYRDVRDAQPKAAE